MLVYFELLVLRAYLGIGLVILTFTFTSLVVEVPGTFQKVPKIVLWSPDSWGHDYFWGPGLFCKSTGLFYLSPKDKFDLLSIS